MLLLRACPKCKGDVVRETDHYGSYMQCVQCGYLRDIAEPAKPRLAVVEAEERDALMAAS